VGQLIDLSGRTFGRLTVVRRARDRVSPNGKPATNWLCVCACGKPEGLLEVVGQSLRRRATLSCGCLHLESITTHGGTKQGAEHPLYTTWTDMHQRCRNPNAPDYKNYGGRGITICARWYDFAAFAADMGERPAGHTLDRRNVNGNYEPSNCRWATSAQQAANKRWRSGGNKDDSYDPPRGAIEGD
jgi:hypothetical protein